MSRKRAGRMRPEIFNLKRDLYALGWRSVGQWADCYGFKPNTVIQTILRYWKTGATPSGDIFPRILTLLQRTLDKRITPESAASERIERKAITPIYKGRE